MEPELPISQNSKSRKFVIVIILVIILFCCLFSVCLFGVGMLMLSNSSSIISQPINHKPDAFVDISVDPDGCGVSREEHQGTSSVSSLTWVITDMDGYSVLERNADHEYKYRYFQSGNYTAHIKAWFNGAYHQISDQVTIDCK